MVFTLKFQGVFTPSLCICILVHLCAFVSNPHQATRVIKEAQLQTPKFGVNGLNIVSLVMKTPSIYTPMNRFCLTVNRIFSFQMELFAEHLQANTVNEKIFPNVVIGFMDTNPVVREHTIKVKLLM